MKQRSVVRVQPWAIVVVGSVEEKEKLRENEVNREDLHSVGVSYRVSESMINLHETSISLFLSL